MEITEEWIPIPGYNARAHPDGYIMGPRGTVLSPMWNKAIRYWWVKLKPLEGGPRKTLTVHTLMALAFRGPKPDWADCVRHLDDNRDNLRASNIAWGTNKDNGQDAIKNERTLKGQVHPNHYRGSSSPLAKLNEEQVIKIREELKNKTLTHQDIADVYGVSRPTISLISRRKIWAHV